MSSGSSNWVIQVFLSALRAMDMYLSSSDILLLTVFSMREASRTSLRGVSPDDIDAANRITAASSNPMQNQSRMPSFFPFIRGGMVLPS